jgi:intracellular sulfur oxidation DsrE/DsrF family protein
MKTITKKMVLSLFFSVCFLFVTVSDGFSVEYETLEGLQTIKAVFDVRTGDLKTAASMLKLIDRTYSDKNITAVMKKPEFAVVFSGPAVKFVSKNWEGFSLKEQKDLDRIAVKIATMSKEGIKLKICTIAAKVFNVDTSSILPGIKQVHNGWISLIGYQSKGYALIPVY